MALNASQTGTDPRLDGDGATGQAVGIARAVELLVRRAHDHADVGQDTADGVEHPLPLDRVAAHDLPLRVVQRARLVDDLLRDGDLPDVVQQRGELEVAELGAGQPQPLAYRHRELDDVAAVAAGVLVVELDDVAEQQRRAAVGGAELERLIDPPGALAREQPQQAMSGSSSSTAPGWSTATQATAKPIGASAASTP
jgi:hypothetical protein